MKGKPQKLHHLTNKFSKNCQTNCFQDELNKYNYQYKNECYESCPNGTFISSNNSYLCEDYCENFYDYNQKKCIDEIPEGFYLNDSIHKTIDKCDIKCQNCTLESILNNNKCLLCNTKKNYYPIFNDTMNNYLYINCYNETPRGYFLDNINYVFKSCYPTCKSCLEKEI